MSSPWRITRGDQQFTVKDVAELKLMAAGSKIESNDLIQSPGGTEWLYATEVTELIGLIKTKPVEEDDDDIGFGRRKRGSSPFVHKLAAVLTIAAPRDGRCRSHLEREWVVRFHLRRGQRLLSCECDAPDRMMRLRTAAADAAAAGASGAASSCSGAVVLMPPAT